MMKPIGIPQNKYSLGNLGYKLSKIMQSTHKQEEKIDMAT